MQTPVTSVKDVLSNDAWQSFIADIETANLEFEQKYPKRLFSSSQHNEWIIETFSNFLESTVREHINYTHIQQSFIGIELPGCHFMLHKSHPAIAGVVLISLDDNATHLPYLQLEVLTDSQNEPEDYIPHKMDYTAEHYKFELNGGIIIPNTDPRYHWGFTMHVPECRVKRSVWFYLGK